MTSNTTETRLQPTFNIFRADGSKVPGLKKSFIIKRVIYFDDAHKGFITLEDNTTWTLLLEDNIYNLLNYPVFCIISMQVHDHGNFAIARKYVEHSKDNKDKELEHHHG